MNQINKFKGLMTSLSCEWATPKWLYNKLDKEFKFDFDPCPMWQHPKIDGLKISWGKRNFINPPYGRVLPLWIEKGYNESLKGKLCVFLIPARPDTRYWHNYILPYAKEIRFIKGRLKFGNSNNSAPFPSCIVIFR